MLWAGFTPAPEDEAADGEAESERPERERSHGDELPPEGEPLPVSERLLFLSGERLTPTPLADRAACAKTEIDVIEELGRFVRHVSSV